MKKDVYKNTICILGDSTSMSIGMDEIAYPFLLAKENCWGSGTRIINCSMPGFTSADAVAFFMLHYNSMKESLKSVVIYLGNCDAASSEINKGVYDSKRHFLINLKKLAGISPRKTRLRNRLLHYEWNNDFNPNIELPESSSDYEKNLLNIIRKCSKAGVSVFLVKPRANLYFPSGVGKGNFVFYRYIGMNENLSNLINIPDERFVAAVKYHESGDFNNAIGKYAEIFKQKPGNKFSQEYSFLVLNNYAAAKAEKGEYSEARYLYQLLNKERLVRSEIVLYNMAQIERLAGNHDLYIELMRKSYEADSSLYRVRNPYVNVIERLSRRFPNVTVFDMHEHLSDSHFLDHCHPLPEGQRKIANAVLESMAAPDTNGRECAELQNILYNPELSMGNQDEFHQYFKSYAPISPESLMSYLEKLRVAVTDEDIQDFERVPINDFPSELQMAIQYYLRHPCFTCLGDVLSDPPSTSLDVGRFPEYFLFRYLVPFLEKHESVISLKGRFDTNVKLVRSSSSYRQNIPRRAEPSGDASQFILPFANDPQRANRILKKVRDLLRAHLAEGSQIHRRRKTTIFWYVREALRFGGHSRTSMLYDRVLLEFLAEGLVVCGVVDFELQLGLDTEIKRLIKALEEAAEIHESYCCRFAISPSADELIREYDLELVKLSKEL